MNKIKRIINWMNWNLGGLRDPESFFEVEQDPIDQHILLYGVDEPTLS